MNAVATEAYERIARKNFDLMGDLVDYAVAQVKTPANTTNPQEAYEQCVAETKAFAEKINARAAEYAALAGELGELAKSKATAAPNTKHHLPKLLRLRKLKAKLLLQRKRHQPRKPLPSPSDHHRGNVVNPAPVRPTGPGPILSSPLPCVCAERHGLRLAGQRTRQIGPHLRYYGALTLAD